MGRKPRIHVEGAFYHFIARGNCRDPIFLEDRHKLRFLELLEEIAGKLGLATHAFCLMTSHLHLILQMIDESVSLLAEQLLGRYSRWFNRERGRTGHLFERRHRSVRVESDRQLIALLRYVHLNPVRAGIVEQPEMFRWSSHRAYLGLESIDWLTTSGCLGLLARDITTSRKRYGELTSRGDDCLAANVLPEVGATRFIEAEEYASCKKRWQGDQNSGNLEAGIEEILKAVELTTHVSIERMAGRDRDRGVTQARAIAALMVSAQRRTTIAALASALDRDASTLSGAASGARRRCQSDHKFGQIIQKAIDELSR